MRTTATWPDGSHVEGEAWFRVDRDAIGLSWGSGGPNDYHGHLDVTGDDTRSTVTVTLSTARTETEQIQQGLEETLANLGWLFPTG